MVGEKHTLLLRSCCIADLACWEASAGRSVGCGRHRQALLMQAVASHKLHEVYTGFADAAGQGGVLRLCVAGDTKVIATTPAAFAAVLRGRPFQPKPAGIYNVFSMFVRRSRCPPAARV